MPKLTISKLWTEQEWAEARAMREEGRSYGLIASCLGRSYKSVESKFKNEGGRKRGDRERPSSSRPSEEVLAQRDIRIAAEDKRDLTARLQGDPPPGFSALEQRTL
jgi:hypothetical protein